MIQNVLARLNSKKVKVYKSKIQDRDKNMKEPRDHLENK